MFIGISKIGAGVLAATLTLGGGSALAASAQTTASVHTPARQAACQQYQTSLAQNLNIPLQQLQDAQKKTKNAAIDARLAAGKITATQAQRAHDRVNAGTGACTVRDKDSARHAVAKVRQVELGAVAQLFNVSKKDLVQELRSGKSLAQVAQEHNVSRDTLKATMRAALKTDLDTLVQSTKITQAQEDRALAAFDKHIDTVVDRVGHAKK